MSALAIAILLVSTATYSTESDDVFTTASACSIEPDGLFPADTVDSTVPSVAAVDPQPRSLLLSAIRQRPRARRGPGVTLPVATFPPGVARPSLALRAGRHRGRGEHVLGARARRLGAQPAARPSPDRRRHGEDHPVPAAREGDRHRRSAASPAWPPASLGDARVSRGPRRQQREDGPNVRRAGPRHPTAREALARPAGQNELTTRPESIAAPLPWLCTTVTFFVAEQVPPRPSLPPNVIR